MYILATFACSTASLARISISDVSTTILDSSLTHLRSLRCCNPQVHHITASVRFCTIIRKARMDGQSLGFLRALAPFRTAGVEEPHLLKLYFRSSNTTSAVAGLTGANKTVAIYRPATEKHSSIMYPTCNLKQYLNAVWAELPPRIRRRVYAKGPASSRAQIICTAVGSYHGLEGC